VYEGNGKFVVRSDKKAQPVVRKVKNVGMISGLFYAQLKKTFIEKTTTLIIYAVFCKHLQMHRLLRSDPEIQSVFSA
jgi:hypothetical protein